MGSSHYVIFSVAPLRRSGDSVCRESDTQRDRETLSSCVFNRVTSDRVQPPAFSSHNKLARGGVRVPSRGFRARSMSGDEAIFGARNAVFASTQLRAACNFMQSVVGHCSNRLSASHPICAPRACHHARLPNMCASAPQGEARARLCRRHRRLCRQASPAQAACRSQQWMRRSPRLACRKTPGRSRRKRSTSRR